MGCGCGKNRYPKKKSSRMPVKEEKITPNQRRARMIKLQNRKRNQSKNGFNWEEYVRRNKKR
tara:strand:- start:7 stop:192 length:186 start_codon:yes stop_codon:yes gene_type:complete